MAICKCRAAGRRPLRSITAAGTMPMRQAPRRRMDSTMKKRFARYGRAIGLESGSRPPTPWRFHEKMKVSGFFSCGIRSCAGWPAFRRFPDEGAQAQL